MTAPAFQLALGMQSSVVKATAQQPARPSSSPHIPLQSTRASTVSPQPSLQKPGLDFHGIPNPPSGMPLTLKDLRERLIRQEETIIFALIERAQFKLNPLIYQPDAFGLPKYARPDSTRPEDITCDGSFSQYMLYELEKVHSKVRRFTSPDEHPFAPNVVLPRPVLPGLDYPSTLIPNSINVNSTIERVYRETIIPKICQEGDDQNYGSSATCDSTCLQALSKRVHYGKFIAEAKCQADEALYRKLAHSNARDQIWEELSDVPVENVLLKRVENKTRNYGSDITVEGMRETYKVKPSIISDLYRTFIIPLTKDVEVDYIIHRYKDHLHAAGADSI